MKTTHSLARELLSLPDVPVFHMDPSLVAFESGDPDDGNISTSAPILELVELSAEEVGDDERALKTFVVINGENSDMESED